MAVDRGAQLDVELFEAMAGASHFTWEPATDRLRWSEGLLRLHGLTRETAGATLSCLLALAHDDERAAEQRDLAETLRTGEPSRRITRIVRPDGVERALDRCFARQGGNGGAIVHGTYRDVTTERDAQRVLADGVERLRVFVDHASDAMFVHDSNDRGRIVDANTRAWESLGMTRGELIGLGPEEIDADLTSENGEAITRALAEQRVLIFETYHRRKDGSVFPVMVRMRGFEVSERQLALAIVTDLTERKALEERLRDAYRLEAIGRLAGGVAHEFNNLLTVMRSACAHLLDGLAREHDHYEPLCDIEESGRRATVLTRQLLAFSRRALLSPTVLSLDELIERHAATLAQVLGPRIRLELSLGSAPDSVEADPTQLQQVLTNLAENARDAMPDGGVFQIETRAFDLDQLHSLRQGAAVQRTVQLRAEDSGRGMDERTRRAAFEPFFTTKDIGHGSGLGLAVVHGIVEQSGGQAFIESDVGRGTTIVLRFPSTTQRPAAPRMSQIQPLRTTLLVEVDPTLRSIVATTLESEGHRVIACATGRDALESAARLRTPPELVITELSIPDMTARELVAGLRRHHPALPVLFVGGFSEETPRAAEGDAFLPKPFTPRELMAQVRRVMPG